MVDTFKSVVGDFPSLEACVAFTKKLPTGKYLFRGERTDKYLTTPPMLARVKSDQRLPQRCRDVIEERSQQLHTDLQQWLDIDSDLAMGFLQHYEVPTDLLDLTSDPEVAAYFAAQGEVHSSGLFAVLPLSVESAGQIQDLTNHPKANRPRRQSAFTFNTSRFANLKADECIAHLGIRWYRFTLQQSDKDLFAHREHLLDGHSDEVAGVIQLLLDAYPKTNDWTAKWLADHVVPAPFITRVVAKDAQGSPIEVELISAESAGMDYDVVIERFNNHRIWSNVYRDTRGSGGFTNLRPKVR